MLKQIQAKHPSSEYEHILKECMAIARERGAVYGNASENFINTAAIHRTMFGGEIKASTCAQVLIANKLAREKNLHKSDNLLDLVNYVAILKLLIDQDL